MTIPSHHAIYLEGNNALFGAVELAEEILQVTSLENHPDYYSLIMDAIKVDDIRDLQYAVSLKPFGDKQVVVIRADALNLIAANALLKVLEEPKIDLQFILFGGSRYNLLATIRSRVQIEKYEDMNSSALTDLASERGIVISTLPIYNELDMTIDELEKFHEKADIWVEFIKSKIVYRDELGIITSSQWLKMFEDREQQKIAVKLIQHYGKSLLLQKKKQPHLWGTLPDYEWLELAAFNEQVSHLTNAQRSNGQFALHLEGFYGALK